MNVVKRAYKRINFLMNDYLRKNYNNKRYFDQAINGKEGHYYGKERLICSLTTIPSRIEYVKYPIMSMMRQTVKPDLIVLYLGKKLFENTVIPRDVLSLESQGLEIRYVDDLRVHTKYYYAFREFSENLVMTVDDDIVYNKKLVENLLLLHERRSNNVICSRAHRITFDASGTPKPYEQWEWDAKDSKGDNSLVATGVGGVLYVPSCFDDIIKNSEVFLELSPNNDDLWLKVVEILSGIKVSTLSGRQWYSEINGSQTVSLNSNNVHNNRNDVYWNNLWEYFKLTKERFGK